MEEPVVIRYRPDVDGLRGIAIIPVMLFHLRVPGFSGGFVGVDVFFVISGYLITSIIHKEIRRGTFSFATFYERRIRRLFPALFTVMAACSVGAIALLLPGDLAAFSKSLGATATFAANVYFWLTQGYFDAPAEFKPLLHTWSLAVEEQFYIFFPLSLLVLQRHLPRRVTTIVTVACLGSFIASAVAVTLAPSNAFYLPMFRAWELFLGVLLALGAVPSLRKRWQRESASILGMVLIGCGVHLLSGASVFPGATALLPTLGTALLIHVGTSGLSGIGRILALRPLVFIGLISYPLYLWHWPLIVFTKYYLVRDLTSMEKPVLLIVCFALASFSWWFVERPFRASPRLFSRRTLFAMAATMSMFFVGFAFAGRLSHRLRSDVAQLASAGATRPNWPCIDPGRRKPLMEQVCPLGVAGTPSFLLWGDSESIAVAPVIDQAAKQRGLAGFFVAETGCPPLVGVERYDSGRSRCRDFSARVVSLLDQHPEIKRVILVGRWALNSLGPRYGDEAGDPAVISTAGVQDNPRAFCEGVERTFRCLHERGREIVFVAQAPEIGWEVPSVLARARRFGRTLPAAPSISAYQDRQRVVTACVSNLSRKYKIRVIGVSEILCATGTCSVEQNGIPLYRDSYHLSAAGAELLAPALEQALADL